MFFLVILGSVALTILGYCFGLVDSTNPKPFSDYVFNLCFAILIGIIGFFIMHDDMIGKINGALLFFCLSWPVSFIFSGLTGLISAKAVRIPVRIVLLLAVVFLIYKTPFAAYVTEPENSGSGYSHRDYSSGSEWEDYDYNNDGEINQNEWEDALGDAIDKYEPYMP